MHKVFAFLSAVCFLLFLLPFLFAGILNIGNMFGMAASAAVSLYALLFRKINSKVKALLKSKAFAALFTACGIVAFLGTVVFSSLLTLIELEGRASHEDELTLIVLGCQVKGETPSLMLSERLCAAYEYLSENPNSSCIVSGGKGKDEKISEAECMYNYLTEHGIDENRIYIEDASTSTYENLKFSSKIISENGLNPKVGIVTNEFHEYRALKLAEKQSITCFAVPAKTFFILKPTYSVREVFALAYEFLFRRSI